MIDWDSANRQFHLHTGVLSHVLRIAEKGALLGLHLGAPLVPGRAYAHLGGGPFEGFGNRLGSPVPLLCPTPGCGDYRPPALVAEQADGSTVLALAYAGHRILPGKPGLPGLPSTYAEQEDEAATLEIDLRDAVSGIEATLSITVFAGRPIVARSMRIRNGGTRPVRITTVMSASLDLPSSNWDLVQLSGTWARERHPVSRRLVPGRQGIASVRGHSSHEQNPFLLLLAPEATETAGEAIAVCLVYSGNFLADAEVDHHGTTRVRIGINPEGFAWSLAPGETFQAPEALIAWSGDGLGSLSLALHGLMRDRLARGAWRDRPRPILINNWEATYFDFDEAKIVAIAESARGLGIELLVLDDGWFGRRDNDDSSLGDWFVDRRKLPNGVDGLARRVEALGMRFGIWIEPEMVSERSDLFAAHPDWAVGIPGRPRTESRQQLVLDMGRPEVVGHLFGVLSELLRSGPISYVKWDMNRSLTEPHSAALPADRQGEFLHRHVLGVYELYRRLTEAFPEVLFESCAGGGGRFDAGMLAFAPQAWTSDDTDGVERLKIQWGTSLAYPPSSMGNHVSAVPNHQTRRSTSIEFRAAVAFFGTFGYELDPRSLTEAERSEVAAQVAFYREHRELFQFGRFLRLWSPFAGGTRGDPAAAGDGNEAAWMTVAPDARQAVVGYYRMLNRPGPVTERLRLRGLDPALRYRVTVWPEGSGADLIAAPNLGLRGGDELMAVGLALEIGREAVEGMHDFMAWLFVLEAV
jgi:alpha-galactosidase